MKTTQHTPGPWAVECPYDEPGTFVTAPSTALVCKVYSLDGETAANARLIAAAPELLELAEEIQPQMAKLKEKAKWLQSWLHNSPCGKTLPAVDRASIGQLLAELFQFTSGGKLPQAARAAIAKVKGEA